MRWDEWRGSLDGRPTLWIRRVLEWRGRRADLHKMIREDDPECFHTHPAYAIRVILWGGYIEQLETKEHRVWFPGMVGLVTPLFCHRISGLRNGHTSISLWLRGKKRARVQLKGSGWPADVVSSQE